MKIDKHAYLIFVNIIHTNLFVLALCASPKFKLFLPDHSSVRHVECQKLSADTKKGYEITLKKDCEYHDKKKEDKVWSGVIQVNLDK